MRKLVFKIVLWAINQCFLVIFVIICLICSFFVKKLFDSFHENEENDGKRFDNEYSTNILKDHK